MEEHNKDKHSPVHAPIPGLGLRSIKTAFATMLTALLYAHFPNSNPTFACIGAIFGMGVNMEDSKRSGGNRFFGTIIGGFIGLGLFKVEHLIFPDGNYWLKVVMVFLGIIILIALCVRFHWPGGVQPGGVVLCIILFNTPPNYINYAIDRMIDTGIGVIISLLVNYEFSRNRVETWLHMKNSKEMDAGTGEMATTDGEENSK
ncbi:MAG: FUSC family protein [Lachnospiraceae bacterium]|nr:FUSC family protein [Lachnospiraceae bacterium]